MSLILIPSRTSAATDSLLTMEARPENATEHPVKVHPLSKVVGNILEPQAWSRIQQYSWTAVFMYSNSTFLWRCQWHSCSFINGDNIGYINQLSFWCPLLMAQAFNWSVASLLELLMVKNWAVKCIVGMAPRIDQAILPHLILKTRCMRMWKISFKNTGQVFKYYTKRSK